jgi:integral membrane protein
MIWRFLVSLRPLGYIAIAEAISFICLLIATVVKYAADQPKGVEILGPLHGMLFVAYVALAFIAKQQRGWSLQKLAVVLLGAVVPTVGYFMGRRLIEEDAAGMPQGETRSA